MSKRHPGLTPLCYAFSFRLYSSIVSPFSASIAFRSFLNIFSKPLFAESMVSETLSFKRSFFSCFSAAFCSLASCLIRTLSSNIFLALLDNFSSYVSQANRCTDFHFHTLLWVRVYNLSILIIAILWISFFHTKLTL